MRFPSAGNTAIFKHRFTFLYLHKIVTGFITVLMLLSLSGTSYGDSGDPLLMKSLILRHRLAVLPISSKSGTAPSMTTLIKILDSRIIFPGEGVTISTEEWATIIDLTKSEISKSNYLRLVDLPIDGDKKAKESKPISLVSDEADLILFVSYGVDKNRKRFFFQLVEAFSGSLIYTAEANAPEIGEAIRKALFDIDDRLLRMPWRCEIISVTGKHMIINRGDIDGLKEGIELVGYSMKSQPKSGKPESEELRLMKYGNKKGLYRVVEVQSNFSKIVPSAGNENLAKGDILELPQIKIRDRDMKTRGRQMWDKIYKK